MKEKIALFCDVDVEAVVTARDVKSRLRSPGDVRRRRRGRNRPPAARVSTRRRATSAAGPPCSSACRIPRDEVSIGIVGKYVEYEDSYKSLKEALLHGGLAHQLKVNIHWIEAEGVVGDGLGTPVGKLRRHPGARAASASAASTAC